MGHTLAQLLHFIWQVSATCILVKLPGNGVFRGDTHDERVPIGQKEHHVRGAYTNDSMMPTMVVSSIIFQKTRPIACQSPQAKYICMPNIANMKMTMNSLKPGVRTNPGMGRWGEYFASTWS